MNKCSAQLQVTSYNFSKTSTSTEVCVGIVKESGFHEKSPQHAGVIEKVEKLECTTSVFLNDEKKKKKERNRMRGSGWWD